MNKRVLSQSLTLCVAFAILPLSAAKAWDPFVTPNENVETGNARMSAGDAAGALAAYELAARQHPDEPRVALDRGLALLESGDLPAAREAFVAAADPDADDEIRAAAYYDLGLAFYREGDAAAVEEDHEASQGFFREAADAFRRSLRVTHGNRDAAWNLELALRRIREEEQAQEEQEQQEQQEQEEQEQDQEGDEQDQQEGDQEGDQQDQQEGDEQGDEQSQDQEGDQQGDEQSDPEQQEGGDEGDEENQEQGGDEEGDEQNQEGEDPTEQDPSEQEGESENQDGGDDQADQRPDQGEQQEGAQNLPNHVERVLDALQDNEQNLERARARARAAREGRRVLRDW